MPHLKELYGKFNKKGLEIIGIHTQGAKAKARDFVAEQAIPYRVGIDKADPETKGKSITIKSLYRVDSYPDYYLIDRKGILRFADLSNKEIDRAIEMLLKEKGDGD